MTQCNILREVRQRPGSSIQLIAGELGVDITTFSRQIKKMEAKKLVNRRASPDDRRVSLLDLTPTGVEVLCSIDNYITEWTAGILERMSRFEQETVARSLSLLNDAIAAIGKTDRNQDSKFASNKVPE
ncbi:MarR family winged helix-turn-helix transcriptional regulator [Geobacter sp. OR-1]|uniref:MarR family winged helix-turn-helix transcriptional regulator n=1 Tax=Geobacter sp. OR-1 TaxID=1266765 RepID=UPI001ED99274|nr:MarR family winged helix-turn-helix transcriptional regulator [Geobacter sp. OR-1]